MGNHARMEKIMLTVLWAIALGLMLANLIIDIRNRTGITISLFGVAVCAVMVIAGLTT